MWRKMAAPKIGSMGLVYLPTLIIGPTKIDYINVGKYTIHGSYGLWDTVDDSANPAPNGRFSKACQNCH